ncbi:MAG TPA: alpha/beta fold hydrolase [Pseudolabrys sp.]|nr:alpha/beta fold hydrolase [Pseudolabrys sp.]
MTAEIQKQQYWAKKGAVDLCIYRKFIGDPAQKPVLFLVHGSSFSALPGYDLQVTGRGSEYSMMDRCAERGFDVWTMDNEGYGQSSRTANNSNISQGADDLDAAMPVVERETGKKRFHFYGQSSGSLKAALFAERHGDRVDRLVLDAFVWTGKDSPTLAKRREQLDRWRSSHVRTIDRATLNNSFTRDKPGTSERVVADAVADAQLAYGDTIPTGTWLDMCAHLPLVEPAKIRAPTLIMRGEHDGIATMEDLTSFFIKLPNSDKQITILQGSAHIAPFGLNAHRFYHILFSFLEMPARRDSRSS